MVRIKIKSLLPSWDANPGTPSMIKDSLFPGSRPQGLAVYMLISLLETLKQSTHDLFDGSLFQHDIKLC